MLTIQKKENKCEQSKTKKKKSCEMHERKINKEPGDLMSYILLLSWKSCVENRQPGKQPVNSKWALKTSISSSKGNCQSQTSTSSDLQAHREELHVCSFPSCTKGRVHDNSINMDACTKLLSIQPQGWGMFWDTECINIRFS
jgi:hypothetical protein